MFKCNQMPYTYSKHCYTLYSASYLELLNCFPQSIHNNLNLKETMKSK